MGEKTTTCGYPKLLRSLDKVSEFLDNVFTVISSIGLTLMTIFIIVSVVLRYILNGSWTWGEEACRYLMVYSIFLGCFLAARKEAHVCVEVGSALSKGQVKWMFLTAAKLCTIIGFGWLTVISFQYSYLLWVGGQTSPALTLPMWAITGSMFIGFLCCTYESVLQVWKLILRRHEY